MITDKVGNGYTPAYEQLAEEFLGWGTPGSYHAERPRILEIGAADGAGMEYFRKVFSTDEVYGVDIDPTRADIPNVTIADQADPGLAWALLPLPSPWDLIVDDASHQAGPTVRTLDNLWPTLRPGGYYVIEDWNYVQAASMWNLLAPVLFGRWSRYQYQGDVYNGAPFIGELSDVDSVRVQHGLIIIRKCGEPG